MRKIRYEVDPHNRLVVDDSGDDSAFPKFRKVLDGQFRTDENNTLSYNIKAPLSEDENIPNQLRLKGEWSLTDDHLLRLTLDKSARDTFGDELTLQGEILDVNKNSLLFAITTVTKDFTQSTYVLDLSGSWRADDNNRLSFHIKKESGRYDILTFNGVWEINKDHQILYQYEKESLIRKKKELHTLIFKGYWDIKKKLRISYVLGLDTDSVFDFKAAAGVFKEDYIEYEVGIELAGCQEPVTRTITLFGSWNLKKDTGLVFEIACEDNSIKDIVFGADIKLTDEDTISFRLKDDTENKDIGVKLELSRSILNGDGEAFLRTLISSRVSTIYAGAAWRW